MGVHASPRRTALLLAMSKTDGPIGRKSIEKTHFLSLEITKPHFLHHLSSHCPFVVFLEKMTLFVFLSLSH